MNPDVFAGVVVALARVTTIAERLLDGDSEGHVRRSIDERLLPELRRLGFAFED